MSHEDGSRNIKQVKLGLIYTSIFLGVLFFSSVLHVMYGNCQTSKWHYMAQCYWMPDYLPEWMLVAEVKNYALENYINKFDNYTGVWVHWLENGTMQRKGNYVNGEFHGTLEWWHDNRVRLILNNYVNGEPHGKQEIWHKNGNKKYKNNYINGQRHGALEYWHENGNKAYIQNHVNGQKHGTFESWYENGDKTSVINYINGKPHGKCESWYENGNKKIVRIYDKGTIISEQNWNEDGTPKIKIMTLSEGIRILILDVKKEREEMYENGASDGNGFLYKITKSYRILKKICNERELRLVKKSLVP